MSTSDTTENDDKLNALLEARHTKFLQWGEPWQACGPEGNDLDAHIILRATIHDCINMQRLIAKAGGHSTMGEDGERLLDFIAVHWAQVVSDEPAVQPAHQRAIELFVDAYTKWNNREEGGEDDLHYAARVARDVLETSASKVIHNEQLPETP